MDIQAFLANLAEIKDQFNWSITGDQTLRGFLKDEFKGSQRCGSCCPVTAVYLMQQHFYVSPLLAGVAAGQMGIGHSDASSIIRAADASRDCDTALRNHLLTAVGISDVPYVRPAPINYAG